MAHHAEVFSRLYVAMVEAGEAAGVLDTVLDRVAIQIEKEQKIKRRIKGAMIYPSVVLVFATLVMVGMLMFLVPVFVKIFDQLGGELPMLTQYVIHASNALRHPLIPGLPIPGVIFFSGIDVRRVRRVPSLEEDRARPREVGWRSSCASRCRSAPSCSRSRWPAGRGRCRRSIAAGVDVMRALEITAQTAGNWVVESETDRTAPACGGGRSIAQPLIESDVFPPMIAQMVKIGEETGEHPKMLSKVADFYEDEVDASIAGAHLDHRADDDGRRRRHGRHDHHRHVPADVQVLRSSSTG